MGGWGILSLSLSPLIGLEVKLLSSFAGLCQKKLVLDQRRLYRVNDTKDQERGEREDVISVCVLCLCMFVYACQLLAFVHIRM